MDVVYVFSEIRACDESFDTGRETWNRLARCAVRWVSDCKWAGSAGSDGCEWEGAVPVNEWLVIFARLSSNEAIEGCGVERARKNQVDDLDAIWTSGCYEAVLISS